MTDYLRMGDDLLLPDTRATIIARALETDEGQRVLYRHRQAAYSRGWLDALAVGIPDTASGKAQRFLRTLFMEGDPIQVCSIFALTEHEDFSRGTLRTVKKRLGISSRKTPAGGWEWVPPLEWQGEASKVSKVATS